MVSQISNFGITGYHNPAAPPTVVGSIVGLLYWYEGLAGWTQLGETPPTVPFGTSFHLAPQWLNQSAEAISGHIELTITKPDGTKVTLNDVLNQDNWAAPGIGWGVQFEPFTMDQAGTYKATATLSSVGQTLAEKTFGLVAPVRCPPKGSIIYPYYSDIPMATRQAAWQARVDAWYEECYRIGYGCPNYLQLLMLQCEYGVISLNEYYAAYCHELAMGGAPTSAYPSQEQVASWFGLTLADLASGCF